MNVVTPALALVVGGTVGLLSAVTGAGATAVVVSGTAATVLCGLAVWAVRRPSVDSDETQRWTTLLSAQGQTRETLAAVERLTDPLAIERRVTAAMRDLAPDVELELLRAPEAPPGLLEGAREIDAATLGAAVVEGIVRNEHGLVIAVRYGPTLLGALSVRGRVAPRLLTQLRRFADLLAFRLELHRTYAELAHRERLAALGTFASALSHDLRSPLASIRLALQGLADHREALDDDVELLDLALEETDRLLAIVGEVLDFARPVELDAAPIDLAAVVELVAQRQRPVADARQVRIVVQGTATLPKIVGDAHRLERALDNLVSNAVSFSPAGADVKIVGSVVGMDVRLDVVDRGPGMSPENRARIFEPFFTRRQGGTGLGLAIVDRIVGAHGGSVAVESALGRGTTVSVCLSIRPTHESETD